MNKTIQWFLNLVAVLLTLIFKAEEEVPGTGNGQAKKDQVTNEIMLSLKDPNVPFNLPSWLPEPVVRWIVSFLVDILVSRLNKTGFFEK